MSQWPGFDQRKVCPQCGDYQTSLGKSERSTASQPKPLAGLALVIVMSLPLWVFTGILVIGGGVPEQYRSAGIILTTLLGLIAVGSLAFIRRGRSLSGETNPFNKPTDNSQSTVYRLYCHRCGYKWEISADEWEMKGRRERDQTINFPGVMPPGKPASAESSEKIEWKPPDPKRGVLIIVGAITISLIAALSVIGLFWSATHPDNPYSLLVMGMGIISALLIYVGLFIAFRPGRARGRVVALVVILLLVLVGFAVRLLLK